MAMKDRITLKNYFKAGALPSQASFENLIDSQVNKIDDGFSKTRKDGLMLSSVGGTDSLLSFYEEIQDEKAQWVINIKKDGIEDENKNDLQITEPGKETPVLTLNKKSRIGINEPNPQHTLDVNGWVSSNGRVGSYARANTIPADGTWHPVTSSLNYCQAFEIVARTGIKGTGKHAIMHAIAVSAFGSSSSRIRKTRGWYNFWKPVRLQLRWVGSTYDYRLEMRCKQNLGTDVRIIYYITQLWSDEELGIAKQFLDTDEKTIK
jgi:hypothetical protein